MTAEHGLLSDVHVWYGLSVVLCGALLFFAGRKAVVGFLDGEIEKIRHTLDDAKRLREEAKAALEGYKERQAEAEKQAKAILAHAEEEAERLRVQAQKDLEQALIQHEEKAMERIRTAQFAALEEVRTQVINKAVEVARASIVKKLDGASIQSLSDETIAEISKLPLTRG